jgi:hypothetical protein
VLEGCATSVPHTVPLGDADLVPSTCFPSWFMACDIVHSSVLSWCMLHTLLQDQSVGRLSELLHQSKEGQAGLSRRIERCKKVHANLVARLQVGTGAAGVEWCASCGPASIAQWCACGQRGRVLRRAICSDNQ